MKCKYCDQEFKPTGAASKRCKECAAKRKKYINNEHAQLNKSLSFNKIVRICNGIYCRGEKTFTSTNGYRLCGRCRRAIKDFEDTVAVKFR